MSAKMSHSGGRQCWPISAAGALLLLVPGAQAPSAVFAQEAFTGASRCTEFAVVFDGPAPPGWIAPPPCADVEPETRPAAPPREAPRTPPPTPNGQRRGETVSAESRSVGLTSDGGLLGGVRLGEGQLVRYVPSEVHGRDGGRFWGTAELVELVGRVAGEMHRHYPSTPMSVGELSAERGGSVPGHRSHQAGRDADIAFYMRDENGRRVLPDTLVGIGDRGWSTRGPQGRLQFDAEANWRLVAALLADPRINVQFIFVAEHVQWMLLDEAENQRAPHELIQRARALMHEPEDNPHANHFHVRIFCARNDRPRCRDDAPLRPLYGHRRREVGELRAAHQRSEQLGLGTERAGVVLLREAPPRRWLDAIRGGAPRALQWPVARGHFNRGFGYTREDNPDIPHNGIDIGAPPGSVIRAAADGLVVFSGEFRSFGNAVFLLHKNGWVTFYVHNERNTVAPGELVRQFQPIALLGNTGISRGPHLHFEFRVGGQPRDPEEVVVGVRRWTDTHGPPERIGPTDPPADQANPPEQPHVPVRIPLRLPSHTDIAPERSEDERR